MLSLGFSVGAKAAKLHRFRLHVRACMFESVRVSAIFVWLGGCFFSDSLTQCILFQRPGATDGHSLTMTTCATCEVLIPSVPIIRFQQLHEHRLQHMSHSLNS